jgi:hypothetical protein
MSPPLSWRLRWVWQAIFAGTHVCEWREACASLASALRHADRQIEYWKEKAMTK